MSYEIEVEYNTLSFTKTILFIISSTKLCKRKFSAGRANLKD